jgi:hypothetical protein
MWKQKIYDTIGLDFVIDQMLNAKRTCKKKKILQFVIMFHFLKHGKPMIDYECMENFFAFFKVEKVPKMHLSDSNGWGMVDCMHDMVLATIKNLVQKAIFFYFNCDSHIFYNQS